MDGLIYFFSGTSVPRAVVILFSLLFSGFSISPQILPDRVKFELKPAMFLGNDFLIYSKAVSIANIPFPATRDIFSLPKISFEIVFRESYSLDQKSKSSFVLHSNPKLIWAMFNNTTVFPTLFNRSLSFHSNALPPICTATRATLLFPKQPIGTADFWCFSSDDGNLFNSFGNLVLGHEVKENQQYLSVLSSCFSIGSAQFSQSLLTRLRFARASFSILEFSTSNGYLLNCSELSFGWGFDKADKNTYSGSIIYQLHTCKTSPKQEE